MNGIFKVLKEVLFLVLYFIVFLIIFILLGMSFLGQSKHYSTFINAFYSEFQIFSIQNWNEILYDTYEISLLCIPYFIVWIFLGNYLLFNLFMSILLSSFEDVTMTNDSDDDEPALLANIPEIFKKYLHTECIGKNEVVEDEEETLRNIYNNNYYIITII